MRRPSKSTHPNPTQPQQPHNEPPTPGQPKHQTTPQSYFENVMDMINKALKPEWVSIIFCISLYSYFKAIAGVIDYFSVYVSQFVVYHRYITVYCLSQINIADYYHSLLLSQIYHSYNIALFFLGQPSAEA